MSFIACAGGLAGLALALVEGLGRVTVETLVTALWLHAVLGVIVGGMLGFLVPRLRRAGPTPGVVLVAVLILGAGAASAWATRLPERSIAPDQAPEILLITCDTTRADRWEAVLDLVRDSGEEARPWEDSAVRFPQAYAPTALTAPSHASLFTGLPPHEHGVLNNGAVLGPWPRLPDVLRSGGYTTLAAPSVIHLDPGFGFARGFDEFAPVEDGLSGALRPLQAFTLVRLLHRLLGAGRAVRDGEETLEEAARLWRAAAGRRPRFLWVHIFEPHWPYEPEARSVAGVEQVRDWPAQIATPGYGPARVDEWRARYDAEILEARRILRGFVAGLQSERAGNSRPLWIVFTSDHGESIGDHASVDHGDLLYEEQIRVPFWFLAPGLSESRTVAAPVTHLDLLPSLCEILGLQPPAGLPGRSWAGACRGEAFEAAPIFAATRHPTFDNTTVRVGDLKLIRNYKATREKFVRRPDGRGSSRIPQDPPWTLPWEAYDLAADPFELRPLSQPLRAAGPEITGLLEAFEAARGQPGEPQNLSPDVIESLQELGYF